MFKLQMKLRIFGVSGISSGGKTTLSTMLYDFLIQPQNSEIFDSYKIHKVHLLHQDKYFYPRDSPNHTWIPEINHINREILSAMDMKRFVNDFRTLVNELKSFDATAQENALNILIVEGYLIFNEPAINRLCAIRFHLYLSYEEGLKRRLTRTFKHVPQHPEWYFKHYIWFYYEKHLNELPNKNELIFLDGELNIAINFDKMIDIIRKNV